MSDLEQINQVLLEEIEKRDEEIQKLRNDINSLLDSPLDSSTSSLPEKEVMKLVKKNRNLIVKLNKAQGQIVQLELQIKQEQEKFSKMSGSMQAKHYGQKTTKSKSVALESNETTQEEDEALDQLLSEQKKKYEKSVLRINELREKNQKLNLEINKMKNLLQKELGDNVDIDALLNESNNNDNWRGRQQEILLLKSKVKQLQNQLLIVKKRNTELNETNDIDNQDLASTTASSLNLTSLTQQNITLADAKQSQTIRQLSEARNQEISELNNKIKIMEESQELWKKKHDAVKARCSILEREISSLNLKMTRIVKKTENDDKYINALKAEVDKLRNKLKETDKKLSNTKTIKPGETLSSTLTILHNQEIDDLQKQVSDLEKELAQKEETIQTLKEQILSANNELGYNDEIGSRTIHSDLKSTLLQLELEKFKELQQLHQGQLRDFELKEQSMMEEVHKYKLKIKELENSLNKFKGKSQPISDDDSQKLADSLHLALDENQALKQTIKTLRSSKEKEIKIYKDLVLKQKKEIETQLEQNTQNSVPSAYIANLTDESLKQENEQLTKNLKEMKNRYTAVSMQLQNVQEKLKQLEK